MTRPALLATAACLLLSAGQVRAALIPGFDLTDCAWHATHIVIVDNKGTVLESWAGDLKPGDRVPIGDFRLPAEVRVGEHAELGPGGKKPPEKISTRRVILFLLKKNAKAGWRPAGLTLNNSYDISTAWVHDGRVYALAQAQNPGPLKLFLLSESEAALKKSVTAVRNQKALLQTALAEPDPDKRAGRLSDYIFAGDLGRAEALRALAGCKKPGAFALADALSRGGYPAAQLSTVRSLVRIGRPARGDLIELLRTELIFWNAVAAGLPADWTHIDKIVTNHLDQLRAALASPRPYEGLSADQRRVLEQIRKLWTENPALRHKPPADENPAILAERILNVS